MKTLHYSSLLFFSAALLLNQPCTGAPGQWEVTGSMVQGRNQQTATLMPTGIFATLLAQEAGCSKV